MSHCTIKQKLKGKREITVSSGVAGKMEELKFEFMKWLLSIFPSSYQFSVFAKIWNQNCIIFFVVS